MRVNVTKPFAYAYEGVRVVRYELGEQEIPDEAAKLAIEERWATLPAKPEKPAKSEEPAKPTESAKPEASAGDPKIEPSTDDGAAAEPTDEEPEEPAKPPRGAPRRRR